ncbi:helix-turn-helix domain-containing protein [Methylocystis sp. IM3]|jgi:CRP-like cAMP-binding protein|uniref:helix-turn-helix domain-containing protein n=1 Tax=unclassified Methylocystis TaxID=2625913 RepID=UPI000FBAA261|nr:MAG: hypothetical protein EKK29_03035 [Hyphomicrobiales bacterium]
MQVKALETIVSDKYPKFKHEFLELLFAVLVDERPVFGNDLDSLLVYTAVSRLYLRDERAGLSSEDQESGRRYTLTATRIAESTRIPRETVRRKLRQLESRGFLEKGPRDDWRVVVKDGQPVIRSEYSHVWQQEMARIVKFVRVLKDHV